MDSLYLMLISLVVAGLVTWRLLIGSLRHHQDERRATNSLQSEPNVVANSYLGGPDYKARSLRVCTHPCNAAIQLRNQSFLANQAPDLPLTNCDRPNGCHCEYAEHGDRRTKKDRRYPAEDMIQADNIVGGHQVKNTDRREKRDRRRLKQHTSRKQLQLG